MNYLAFYDLQEYNSENRAVAPSAANVVAYMADVFKDNGEVNIISPSRTLNKKGFYKGRRCKLSNMVCVNQPPTFGSKTKIGTLLAVLYTRLWTFFYLLLHVKQKETLVVYHSLAYMDVVRLLKKLKKLTIIMEVREIYSDVKDSYKELQSASNSLRKKEFNYFSVADKFIFPTEMLNDLVNKQNKPYVIATGIYKSTEKLAEKRKDKIHVVYAGTLRPEKGAAAATSAALFLDDNYHIHILGYGSEEIVKEIKGIVSEVNKESKATVSYDGLLRGDDFNKFLQSCHIGVATQDPSSSITNTSFPSKILTYLSNGLEVLCADIPAVKSSPVGDHINYYSIQEAQIIADMIKKIDVVNSKHSEELLKELDYTLRNQIKDLLT